MDMHGLPARPSRAATCMPRPGRRCFPTVPARTYSERRRVSERSCAKRHLGVIHLQHVSTVSCWGAHWAFNSATER
jgi:hypothetical protein